MNQNAINLKKMEITKVVSWRAFVWLLCTRDSVSETCFI